MANTLAAPINITVTLPEIETMLLRETNIRFVGHDISFDGYVEFVDATPIVIDGNRYYYQLYILADEVNPYIVTHFIQFPTRLVNRTVIECDNLRDAVEAIIADYPHAIHRSHEEDPMRLRREQLAEYGVFSRLQLT